MAALLDFLRGWLGRTFNPTPMPETPKTPAIPAIPASLPATAAAAAELQAALAQLLKQMNDKTWGTQPAALPAFQAMRKQDAAYQGRLALVLAAAIQDDSRRAEWRSSWDKGELLSALLRGTLVLSEAEWVELFTLYGLPETTSDDDLHRYKMSHYFSLSLTLTQLARHAKKRPLQHEPLLALLRQLLAETGTTKADDLKNRDKLREILRLEAANELPTVEFASGDPFGEQLTQFAAALAPADAATRPWLQLLQLWQRASGGQPNAKYGKETAAAVAAIGPAAVRAQARQWLELLATTPVREEQRTYDYGNGSSHTYTSWEYLMEPSVAVAKGLVWTVQPLADAAVVQALVRLAAKCYRKIPGKGPLAAGLGNACLWALSQAGLPGVSALAQVRGKIKQSNTQGLIANYIEQESAKLGVSPAEIEDMATPDAGLENGQSVETLDDYTATLTLHEGKAEVAWAKAGKPLKSAPAALKTSHADELKELKLAQTTAQQTYTAQRERLDRSFIEERRMPWPWFERYYFQHGLMSLLAHPLIWRFHHADGAHHDALFLHEQWQDAHGQPVPAPADTDTVQLWHPVLNSTEQVLAWRELLETNRLRQPVKQAFREVYLLTPPEERTRTYSNRMAAHVLKQHQFNSLAKIRGWKYSLLGAYDKGYESEEATLALPAHNLQAEFWVSEVSADDSFNDTGIWHYVSTDQVRFTRGGEAVPLPDLPALAFSEVMRDVDLFVGVASVGNDPMWRDNGGLAQYRNYWEQYSFGELGEVAKNRKLALERLVPRLKIGKVSEIRDKFLYVKGHLHTYKIHLGSGNILMEPNDQYLCIVPDRSAKTMGTADVFLPFEGDAVLSIILSKALLLMEDDKITDETILRQIK